MPTPSVWDQFQLAPPAQAPTAPDTGGMSNVHGEDYLKTLEPQYAAQVKAYAEGRQPIPAGFALKNPYFITMMKHITNYDPSFDAANYNARSAQRKNYMGGGKQYQELQAIGTVAGHLHDLAKTADGLDNTSFPIINTIKNYALQATGDPRVDKFNTVKQAVANELSKAYRGGHVTEGDVREWQQNVSAAKSPDQLKSVIGQLNDLLMSKRMTLEEGYKQTMGPVKPPTEFSSVNDRTRQIFDNISQWAQGQAPLDGKAEQTAPALNPGKYIYDPAAKKLVPAQ